MLASLTTNPLLSDPDHVMMTTTKKKLHHPNNEAINLSGESGMRVLVVYVLCAFSLLSSCLLLWVFQLNVIDAFLCFKKKKNCDENHN